MGSLAVSQHVGWPEWAGYIQVATDKHDAQAAKESMNLSFISGPQTLCSRGDRLETSRGSMQVQQCEGTEVWRRAAGV